MEADVNSSSQWTSQCLPTSCKKTINCGCRCHGGAPVDARAAVPLLQKNSNMSQNFHHAKSIKASNISNKIQVSETLKTFKTFQAVDRAILRRRSRGLVAGRRRRTAAATAAAAGAPAAASAPSVADSTLKAAGRSSRRLAAVGSPQAARSTRRASRRPRSTSRRPTT